MLQVSIIRVGLAETKKFAEGYSAIFGGKKKKEDQQKPSDSKDEPKKAKGKKKTKKV